MSEPRVATGRAEVRACPGCGAEIEHREYIGAYGSGGGWSAGRHLAPCGLPCFRGGVGPAVYRSGEAHGLVGYPPGEHPATEWDEGGPYDGAEARPCPACTGLPAVPHDQMVRVPHPGRTG